MKGRTIYSIVAILGIAGVLNAGVSVKDGVVSYKVEAQESSRTVDFSKAKPMVKTLPDELFDPEMIEKALLQNANTASEKAVAEGGSPGSGAKGLSQQIPLTKIEPDGKVAPAEYGDDINGINLPYTTSRVDMYGAPFSRKYPYRAAGQLFFNVNGSTSICSASMIRRGVMVTAAHCVCEYGKSTMYSDWTYVPARKRRSAPYGQWQAQHVYVLNAYYAGASGECLSGVVCKDDVAVIVLQPQNGKYAGDYTGWYGFGIGGYSYINRQLAQITQLGYPASHDKAELMQRNDSVGVKGDADNYKSNTLIGSRMTGGSSGGPWLVNFGQKAKLNGTTYGHASRPNVVVGVTSWGYTSSDYKIQGASPFTKGNIKRLVAKACSDYPDACRK